jgi:hypothetical protein
MQKAGLLLSDSQVPKWKVDAVIVEWWRTLRCATGDGLEQKLKSCKLWNL